MCREIQSFVRRSGRLTPSQRRGLGELSAGFLIERTGAVDFAREFGNDNPVVLEVGFGNGDSLLTMAIDAPHTNFVGIEVYEAGIGRLISGAHQANLSNLRLINGDAARILSAQILDNSLARFQLFFPDPWHKKKHHKRRLIKAEFLDLLSKKLRPAGIIHVATDWADYARQIMHALEAHPNFHNVAAAFASIPRPDSRPITKFERRGQRLEHVITDLQFINQK